MNSRFISQTLFEWWSHDLLYVVFCSSFSPYMGPLCWITYLRSRPWQKIKRGKSKRHMSTGYDRQSRISLQYCTHWLVNAQFPGLNRPSANLPHKFVKVLSTAMSVGCYIHIHVLLNVRQHEPTTHPMINHDPDLQFNISHIIKIRI